MREDDGVYQKLLDAFGEDMQYTIAFEEMSELTKALCKFQRKKDSCSEEEKEKLIHNILEEIADVEFSIEQLTYMFNGWDEVKKQKSFKAERAMERAKSKNINLNSKKVDKR